MTILGSPDPADLPTRAQLNRATLIAAGMAAVVLVTAVLPAEYGLDPTGVGGALGLTAMGELKQAEAGGGASAATATADYVSPYTPGGPGEVRITLGPYQGREVKATMAAGDTIRWRWSTDGAEVNYEFHGEAPGATEGDYTSYERGKGVRKEGNLTAAFAGNHGWYWKNYTPDPVVVTAEVTGQFSKFAPLD